MAIDQDELAARAKAMAAAGDSDGAMALIGDALAARWSKPLFQIQARIAKGGEPDAYERFLADAVRARLGNTHAARLLIGLRLDKVPSDGALAQARIDATDGPILRARHATLLVAAGRRGEATGEAIRALDAISDRKLRRTIANAIAAAFDWHGHPREAENLVAHGRTTAERFDTLFDWLTIRQVAAFDETTRALFAFSGGEENPHRAALARLHFDWRWRVDGPSAALLDESAAWEAFVPGGDLALRAERIAMACELGDWEQAKAWLAESPGVAELSRRVLPVAKLLAEDTPHARLFDALTEGSAALVAMLANPAARVAVVGNSPCERGLGKGAAIDAHDVVIRFNHIATDEAHVADYGRRTDVHVLPIRADAGSFPPAADARLIAYVMPHARFRFRHWDSAMAHRAAGRMIADLPGAGYARLAMRLRSPPSAGLRILAMLHELRGPLDPASLFGFAFTDQIGKGATSSHYHEETRPSMHHNWVKERAIFLSFLRDG